MGLTTVRRYCAACDITKSYSKWKVFINSLSVVTGDFVLSFFSFFIYPATDIKAYKLNISGQDRKTARAALITALNTSKTHVYVLLSLFC